MKNDRLLKALKREPTDARPVWMMRQAGRYLPEYRKIREKAGDFMALCQNPELACEVTLQPLRRYALDAAIVFSDILTIPDAMGLGLYFTPGEGPKFENPITKISEIEKLTVPNPEEKLAYVTDTIKLIKHELNDELPLIGFAGSPWTLATYMIENGSSKTFSNIKTMMVREPDSLHLLLKKLADSIIVYLQAQIDAGADVIMIFDTWGGILTPDHYQQFSLQYMRNIVSALKKQVPVILFTKNAGFNLTAMADSGCDGLSVDWSMRLTDARKLTQDKVALQGNLDPAILHGNEKQIREAVKAVLDDYGNDPGHIFNLGHGITPDIPPESVSIMVDAAHKFSQK
jgi:uroporphyrinogen decarboxylase